MRNLFYVLATISFIVFAISAVQLRKQFSISKLPELTQLKGFEDEGETGQYTALIKTFRSSIKLHTDKAQRHQNAYFWLSFLVTTLSAGSTLISGIQASKKPETETMSFNKFAILLASITFLSTIANYTSTHFNESKTVETKKATDLNEKRSQFFADYDKATTQEAKNETLSRYASQLD